jgi:hypothetical protein
MCIVGVVAIIALFLEPTRCCTVQVMRVRVSLHIPIYQLVRPCWLVGGPLALLSMPGRLEQGVRTTSIGRDGYSGQERIKGMESTGWIHAPILLPSCTHLFIFSLQILGFQILTTDHYNGFSPPMLPPSHQGWPCGTEASAWVAITGV